MVKAIKGCGGDKVKVTIYPEVGHDAWNQAYDDEALYRWFLEHVKTAR
jgi:hypothetical protein